MTRPIPWSPAVRAQQGSLHTGKAAKETARAIISRIDSQGWKGKKRDTMAFELWMGALCNVQALFGHTEERPSALFDHMARCAALIVSVQGYKGLLQIRDNPD